MTELITLNQCIDSVVNLQSDSLTDFLSFIISEMRCPNFSSSPIIWTKLTKENSSFIYYIIKNDQLALQFQIIIKSRKSNWYHCWWNCQRFR